MDTFTGILLLAPIAILLVGALEISHRRHQTLNHWRPDLDPGQPVDRDRDRTLAELAARDHAPLPRIEPTVRVQATRARGRAARRSRTAIASR